MEYGRMIGQGIIRAVEAVEQGVRRVYQIIKTDFYDLTKEININNNRNCFDDGNDLTKLFK